MTHPLAHVQQFLDPAPRIPRHWVGLQLRRELDRLEKIKRPEHNVIPLLPSNG